MFYFCCWLSFLFSFLILLSGVLFACILLCLIWWLLCFGCFNRFYFNIFGFILHFILCAISNIWIFCTIWIWIYIFAFLLLIRGRSFRFCTIVRRFNINLFSFRWSLISFSFLFSSRHFFFVSFKLDIII